VIKSRVEVGRESWRKKEWPNRSGAREEEGGEGRGGRGGELRGEGKR